jgi:hypothetical protein
MLPTGEWESPSPASFWSEPVDFEILAPSGQSSGIVRFPDGIARMPFGRTETAFIAYGDVVWAVTLSDDTPLVRRYHVMWK